ncbi:MAG TPA: 4'-phosphopantetheinyl transferase superfamily protein [Flavobacterium sp.]|uniref:4'-phosphopantetheinyl transferase family protein n=1 Tax=Flavobacterium sp. TaxID=239 RepID=UPI002B4B4959|nr:4'-phosphopantetheinyl transferase superfamily protein [Flavobacterium sp.]HLO74098.1 4'-phosphopantetheinyl transferase superfamily protein [Flavobacterium sp.]
MPLHRIIHINETTTAYFWHITEDVTSLFRAVSLKDTSLFRLEGMKSEEHQRGFLAVRMLLQHLGYTDYDLTYDEAGKPNLSDGKNISISHSHEFSCICISDELMGIDLEKLKEKTLKIAPRFMDVKHLVNLSKEQQLQKATVVWGIKEAIFKIKNEKGISFPNHIFEDEFDLSDATCVAELKFNKQIEKFNIHFYSIEDYIFVCAIPN